uniref:Uncharacterized protein n=1 Tax=Rhizophora mucronata TaxID=61149 RepID=A0A2P2R022_RHIMU
MSFFHLLINVNCFRLMILEMIGCRVTVDSYISLM